MIIPFARRKALRRFIIGLDELEDKHGDDLPLEVRDALHQLITVAEEARGK